MRVWIGEMAQWAQDDLSSPRADVEVAWNEFHPLVKVRVAHGPGGDVSARIPVDTEGALVTFDHREGLR